MNTVTRHFSTERGRLMQLKYHFLPKRVLILWELFTIIVVVLLFAIAYLFLNHYHVIWYITMWLIGALGIFLGFLYFPLLYVGYQFALSDHEIILHRGVIFHKRHYLKRDKITFVTLFQDPISSAFGLTTLSVASPGANLLMPFMDLKLARRIAKELSFHQNFKEI